MYTFNVQNNGLNKNSIDTNENEETISYNKHFDQNSLYIESTQNYVTPIVSEDEYYMLIKYSESDEKPEIALFESFIEDAIQFEDYLSNELLALLNRYKNYMISLEINPTISFYEHKALERFKNILDKQDKLQSSLNKDNVHIRIRKLEEQYNKAGYTMIYFLFGFTILTFIISIVLLINK